MEKNRNDGGKIGTSPLGDGVPSTELADSITPFTTGCPCGDGFFC